MQLIEHQNLFPSNAILYDEKHLNEKGVKLFAKNLKRAFFGNTPRRTAKDNIPKKNTHIPKSQTHSQLHSPRAPPVSSPSRHPTPHHSLSNNPYFYPPQPSYIYSGELMPGSSPKRDMNSRGATEALFLHIDFLNIFKIFNFTKHGHVINYKHKTSKKIGY